MIGRWFLPVLLGVLISGFTDNTCAGSIQTSDHIHHNPVHLSKRKICCGLGQSDSYWETSVSVNRMDPPKLAINAKIKLKKTSQPDSD